MLRLDEAEVVGIERSPDAGDCGAQRERGDLECPGIEPHQIGHALIVMHGGHRDAEPRREQHADDCEHDDGDHDDDQAVKIARHRISSRASDEADVEQSRLHDLTQRECRKRKIDAASAKNRTGDDETNDPGGDCGRWNSQQRRQAVIAQDGRCVGADRGKPRYAEIELAGRHR